MILRPESLIPESLIDVSTPTGRFALVLPAVILAVSLAALPTAHTALAQARTVDASEQARVLLDRASRCIAKSAGYRLRPMLEKQVGRPGEGREWLQFISLDCFGDAGLEDGAIRFKPLLFRASLYEALYSSSFGKRAAEDFADVAPIIYPIAPISVVDEGVEAVAARSYIISMTIGECVVRSVPGEARGLLSTKVASAEERAAIDRLMPSVSECIPQGQTMTFSRSMIRGLISEPLYRLTAAKRKKTDA